METNRIQFKFILCFVLLIFMGLVFASSKYKNGDDIYIRTGESYYLMDKALVSNGYSLKKANANVSIIYKNTTILMNEFYMSSIGPDKTIKLYVELTHTLKNANVFLNAKLFTVTNANGVAFVEKHKQSGLYELKISDKQKSLHYFFSLDKSMKLVCVGVNDFKCNKFPYQ